MPETLPGDPTEAGPDSQSSRDNGEPDPDYKDLIMFAEEETCFARQRYFANTSDGRRHLLEAIYRAKAFLDSSEMIIKDMEAIRAR